MDDRTQCEAIRDALRGEAGPHEEDPVEGRLTAEQRRHVEECPLCAEVVASASMHRRLLRDLEAEEESAWGSVPSLPPPTLADRIDSAPLPLRRAAALSLVVIATGAVALAWLRPDLSVYPPIRFATELAVLGFLGLAAVWNLLHPVYRSVPTRTHTLTAAALFFAAPFLLAAGTPVHLDHPLSLVHGASHLLQGIAMCLAIGAGFSIGTYGLLSKVDQGGFGAALSGTQRAAASGLVALLVLHLHCPNTSTAHIVASHTVLPLLAAGTSVGITYLMRRYGKR